MLRQCRRRTLEAQPAAPITRANPFWTNVYAIAIHARDDSWRRVKVHYGGPYLPREIEAGMPYFSLRRHLVSKRARR
jgi:hypothetical protein